MSFIFWFFLVGFLIAALQDFKRREVDNWLNLFIFFSGFIWIIIQTFAYKEISFLINFGFLTFFMFGLANLFYVLRIFAGGDCKLLFASTPILVSFDFLNSLENVLFFCTAMLILGAIYGLFWIIGLFFKEFEKNKLDLFNRIKKTYFYLIPVLIILLLSFVDTRFLFFFYLSAGLVLLFYISKSVEKNSLIKSVSSHNLREGDWLEKDIIYNGQKIKANFEGLSLENIKFLRNYKKNISIKDGIPFAPVFFFSWILFYFRGLIMESLALILGV